MKANLPLHTYYSDAESYTVLKLPHSRLLKLLARFMVLMLIFVALFVFTDMFDISSSSSYSSSAPVDNLINENFDLGNFLPLLFHDLITSEGILTTGSKAAFLVNTANLNRSQRILKDKYSVDSVAINPDLDGQREIPDGYFDIIVANSFNFAQEFMDRTLKNGGVMAFNLGDNNDNDNNSFIFNKLLNYKIVYMRKFHSANNHIALAMKKIKNDHQLIMSTQKRKLLGCNTEARKAALKKLENVLLEPPRAASGKSSRYLKKTKFLPDLMGDSLESYPRRVFIDVGLPEKEGGSGTGWFAKNYPTRNLDFDMYKIETVTQAPTDHIGMSDWVRKNVKEEDYVVMKAQVEVVEEMMETKAIRMVDELFMECKPRGHGGTTPRAYWECLALYGRLTDQGIAVHQWWG